MFLVRFDNALGPQSVFCHRIDIEEDGELKLTTARDVLCYQPITKANVITYDKRDW